MAEIKKKLDQVVIDVLENPDGSLTYQGATYVYAQELWDNDVLVQSLTPIHTPATPADAIQLLGETAGEHVKALAETGQVLADEREARKAEVEANKADVLALEQRAAQAEASVLRLEGIISGAKKALGVIF